MAGPAFRVVDHAVTDLRGDTAEGVGVGEVGGPRPADLVEVRAHHTAQEAVSAARPDLAGTSALQFPPSGRMTA
jgi:hypothetical protein